MSIPDDKEAGTIDEFLQKEGVLDILQKLDHDLVGLKPVKDRVREIAALLVVDKLRSRLGLTGTTPSLHMAFTGSPGTGKTTVAMRMGQILKAMGYSRSGHLIVATRDDLVGQYVGHTAPKTKEVIKRAFGGVLFIDEAYYLYNAANDRDYGVEAIEILLNVMEEQREDLVVIFAGYEDRMNKFYSYIPGISSRIGNHISFPDYTLEELVDIAKVMVRDMEYRIADDAIPACRAYIEKRMQMPYFSNARTVRNLINRARMRSAIRIFNKAMDPNADGLVSRDELMTLITEDFPTVQELLERGETAIVE
uniref:Ribulose bisphosphate carboxylase/oxygenase activase, chloroplastic n=2 Tax=Cyanidioschyzon merolae (strain NIES-3377 / 10D) TaxID=280699 RepID=CBBX_CYAM1|nr:RecName: Full=Ribulose bisphosphate carboxylase/oxygenase activase, chloroplastic; Short=RuBisCO activase; AltName: Full=Protein CbbX homolog; Flags: Precursor [Cyanidioschyzon merolae strain 10D]